MQHVKKAEKGKCGECRGGNHKNDRCSSVRLWRES